jgi:hypothetical protein
MRRKCYGGEAGKRGECKNVKNGEGKINILTELKGVKIVKIRLICVKITIKFSLEKFLSFLLTNRAVSLITLVQKIFVRNGKFCAFVGRGNEVKSCLEQALTRKMFRLRST